MKNYSKRTVRKFIRYRTPSRRLAGSQARVRKAQLLSELPKRERALWAQHGGSYSKG